MLVRTVPLAIVVSALSMAVAAAPVLLHQPDPPRHLAEADRLADGVRPEDTSYEHEGGFVTWKGEGGAQRFESHTDCSGLLTALFEHAYGLGDADVARWLGKRRPVASTYVDAIVAGNGFRRIARIGDVVPGDVIAIEYPPEAEDTGHIMIVDAPPRPRGATKPIVDGTEQWEVPVVDSSASGHGPDDTRRNSDRTFRSGVGRGIFRVYTDRSGAFVGYTWSTFANSDYYERTSRALVVGRLDLRLLALPGRSSGARRSSSLGPNAYSLVPSAASSPVSTLMRSRLRN